MNAPWITCVDGDLSCETCGMSQHLLYPMSADEIETLYQIFRRFHAGHTPGWLLRVTMMQVAWAAQQYRANRAYLQTLDKTVARFEALQAKYPAVWEAERKAIEGFGDLADPVEEPAEGEHDEVAEE